MPTGYTSEIKNGQSFKDFAMMCARAFGACILMRDDPMDKPIPDKFEPSDYNLKKLNDAEIELALVNNMTIKEAEKRANAEYDKRVGEIQGYIKERIELKAKYSQMLSQVKAWQIPSEDHREYKQFMIDQINRSIEFDCSDYYEKELKELKRLSGQEWKDKEVKRLTWDINYHKKEHIEEVSRTEGRTTWIKQLRSSLEGC